MAQSRSPITPITRPPTWTGDASAARRHNLPASLTRFIGREREVAEIAALLATSRLLTLTGSGGCGKTRLALAVAEAQARRSSGTPYPDGIWFVEFAGLIDPELVPQMMTATLGIREEPQRPILDTLADALRAQSPLLILDNCEHVIAAAASVVDTLLRGCPHLRILTTSREALRVPGEVTWRVPSLSLPDGSPTHRATRLAESEAVQLFVDRVRLRQPAFALTDENAATVAAICRRLDGVPLALELAAARASVLPLPQLESRLDDALRLLTTGERTALPRHQTLRGTLDWSYALLVEDERSVLQRLSIFAGGCGLEAAEAICAEGAIATGDVLPLLAVLVEKSLVQAEEQDGEARYRLLETVRQYAGERLDASGQAVRVRQMHAEWYLALSVEATTALEGPEQAAWMDRLAAEHDNLRAALRHFIETGQAPLGLRASVSLWRFWYAREFFTEGSRWLAAFLALPDRDGTMAPTVRMDALFALGRLEIIRADYDSARVLLEEMLAIARRQHDPDRTAYALVLLGHSALEQCNYAGARALYEEGLGFARASGNARTLALALGSLGPVVIMQGDAALARTLVDESFALFREVGDTVQVSRCLRWMGVISIEQGDTAGARGYFTELLRLIQGLHTTLGIAEALEGFAALLAAENQPASALRLIGAASAIRATVGSPLPRYWDEWLAHKLEPARRVLDLRACADAEAEGGAMPLADAIANALRPEPASDRRTARARHGGLTMREWQVVTQVTAGKTNREIAEALFVTEKTIEWHVSNSLQKLGFRTRAELAVWAVTAAPALASSMPPSAHRTRQRRAPT